MKDFTRVCRIEPQAVGEWLKQTVPITPRGPVVTLDTVHNRNKTAQDGLLGLQIFIITLYNKC
jgi:hypothetical protein